MSDNATESLWENLRSALIARVNSPALAAWIDDMRLEPSADDLLLLSLPTRFAMDWIKDHYRDLLDYELKILAPERQLDFIVRDPDPDEVDPLEQPTQLPTQAPLPVPALAYKRPPNVDLPNTPLNPRYTFETFVRGSSNDLAASASMAVAAQPGLAYNPLFVYGHVGLGKTHLVQAIGHQVREQNPAARIQYRTTEEFVNDVVEGIRYERMEAVRAAYRDCELLIIDDVQFIAGKEACQKEFFNTFNALHNLRHQIVITSDKLPNEIKDLEDRLKSRFQWGLIVDLQPPELETRIAILQKKAKTDGIALPEDVALLIAESVRSNVRELEGSLIRTSAFASLRQRPITLDLAKEALQGIIEDRVQLTTEGILKQVANYFDVKVSDIKGRGRTKSISFARSVSMYLCRELLAEPYKAIGECHGGKDHTTVITACKRIQKRKDDTDVAPHLEQLTRTLTG